MKMKRILSAAMAAAVAGSIAVSASANFDTSYKKDCVNGLSVSANWLLPIYARETETTPAYDHGIDLSKVGSAVFTLVVNEDTREFFDGAFGGAAGASIHSDSIEKLEAPTDADKTYDGNNGKCTMWDWYNWDNAQQYWGVIDADAKNPMAYDIDGDMEGELKYVHTIGTDKTLFLETLAPYTYRIKAPIVNPVADGKSTAEDIQEFRVFLQMWNADMYDFTVTRCVILDTDGKAMIAFDKLGNVVDTNADDEKEPVYPEAPPEEDPETPSEPEASTPAADNSTPAESTPAASTPAASTPAASSAPATSESNSSSSSGLPVPAIIGIAAGVGAVIAVVIVVIKKKKG